MAVTLNTTIVQMFAGLYSNCWFHSNDCDNSSKLTKKVFMEIPITGDRFEVPCFAIKEFISCYVNNTVPDYIIAELSFNNYISSYKSVERALRDVLRGSFNVPKLVKIETKKGEQAINYYGTAGALFDKNLKPLFIASWVFKRIPVIEDGIQKSKYMLDYPVLRVNPETFIAQSDPVEKFVSNKLLKVVIQEKVKLFIPSNPNLQSLTATTNNNSYQVRVEIVDSKLNSTFSFKEVNVPSISTTNEYLTQIAMQHIEDTVG